MTALRYNPIKYFEELIDSGLNEKIARVIVQHDTEISSIILNESSAIRDGIKDMKTEIIALEMRLQAFTIKCTLTVISVLGILQGIFHFIK